MSVLPRAQAPEDAAVRAMVRAAVFPEAATPVLIGRFVVVRMLGAGGMGVVYLGKDEALDRLVAVKLLAPGSSDERAVHARLEREAKIMARLNHPNVVGVYESGEHQGRMFVAMEYVEGRTLGRWLVEEAPSWQTTLAVFVQAGRGLMAAHAARVIHRDFKPSNVLVGDDGRVRVADFGLAHGGVNEPATLTVEPSLAPTHELELDVRTRTGQRLGTLRYMSPEQFRGEAIDARSDQFSFCVALWEALHGSRPYPADSIRELQRMFDVGVIDSRATDRRIPRWLDEAVARGLAIDVDSRWPSMEALIDRLSRDPARRRRRISAVAVSLAVVGVGGYLLAQLDATPEPASCAAGDGLAGVWDQTRELELERALASSKLRFAGDVWPRAKPALDAYAGEWLDIDRERCRAHAQGEDSDSLHDRATRCLAESRAALDAAVTLLIEADPKTLTNAAIMIAELPSVARCNHDEVLDSMYRQPDDPVLAGQLQAYRERLAELAVHFDAGRVAHVGLELDALEPAILAADAAPLETAFWSLRGRLAAFEEDWDPTIQLHRKALSAAIEAGDHERAMWLAVSIAEHSAQSSWRDRLLFDVHANLARSLPAHGNDQVAVEAALEVALARHQLREGNLGDAFATFERGAKLARQLDDAQWQARFGFFLAFGHTAASLGRLDACEEATREVLAIQQRFLGPHHPSQLEALTLLAGIQSYLDPEAALLTIDRAEPLSRETEGEYSFRRLWLLKLRGMAQDRGGDLEGSLATLREVAKLAERIDTKLLRGDIDNSIGVVLDRLGRHAEARDVLAALIERGSRENHDPRYLGIYRLSLADALFHLGETAAARAEYEAALAVLGPIDPDGPFQVYAENGLGLVDVAERRWRSGRERLEQTIAQREANHASPEELAVTRFGLARALWHTGDRERASELAERALAAYRELGSSHASAHAEVEAWLADPS